MGHGEKSVERLHDQIEQWRNAREYRCAMPERLWQQAVKLAKGHGIYQVSKACNLNCGNLKKRLEASVTKRSRTKAGDDFSFVELEGVHLESLQPRSAAVTVQVIDGRGASLKIEYSRSEEFEFSEVMRWFWRRGQ